MSSRSRRRRKRRSKSIRKDRERAARRAEARRQSSRQRARQLSARERGGVLETIPRDGAPLAAASRYAVTLMFLGGALVAPAFAPRDPSIAVAMAFLFLAFQVGATREPDSLPEVMRQMGVGGLLAMDLMLLGVGYRLLGALGATSFLATVLVLGLFGFVFHQVGVGSGPRPAITFLPSTGKVSTARRLPVGPAGPDEIRILDSGSENSPVASGEGGGPQCGYCAVALGSSEARRVCVACGIPHHTDCWKAAGACTTYGCVSSSARSSA